jgi:D-alanyl-D-alanine carboxypeptidase/D-alanyl-D-alanine-endopeptidase (penicillin-binding protein 4)
MNRIMLLAVGLLFLSGCAILQFGGRPSDPVEALRYDIDQILSDSIFIPSNASVAVGSLSGGELLYAREPHLLLRPASNMKLLTSSAALQYLGENFEFLTEVLADSTDSSGAVHGNIYLKGLGDPDLMSSDLDSLADLVKQRGIRNVSADVVVDVSYFDSLYWGMGWMWDDEPYSYEAFISPLCVNDNCVSVQVIPAPEPADSATVILTPKTDYVTLVSHVRTVGDTTRVPLTITRLYMQRLNTIVVEGEILTTADTVDEQVTVWRPELYAGTLFREALQRQGVSVAGSVSVGTVPPFAFPQAVISRPMDTVLVNLDKVSDNLSAENLLKTISATQGGVPGSSQYGIWKVNEFLDGFGIDTTKFLMVDASGVSHYNLLTTSMLVQLLQGMASRTDLFPLFYRSLPIAGRDGTLSSRMRGTPAEGNMRAKTGTISGACSLSGYVTDRDGEMLVFSMMMQNYIGSARLYRNAQDRIGALLASFSRGRRFAAY